MFNIWIDLMITLQPYVWAWKASLILPSFSKATWRPGFAGRPRDSKAFRASLREWGVEARMASLLSNWSKKPCFNIRHLKHKLPAAGKLHISTNYLNRAALLRYLADIRCLLRVFVFRNYSKGRAAKSAAIILIYTLKCTLLYSYFQELELLFQGFVLGAVTIIWLNTKSNTFICL